MVKIYTCKSCEEGHHENCEKTKTGPEGTYGGSICRCPCNVNSKSDEEELFCENCGLPIHPNVPCEELMRDGKNYSQCMKKVNHIPNEIFNWENYIEPRDEEITGSD